MSGYLTTVSGENVPVRDGFVIGRVAGCDLVIQDGKASRRHARIVVAGGVAELEDLQSSNGTRLNDKPVTRRMLRDGDRIQIGATVLVYREGAAPGAAPAATRKPAASAGDDDDDLLGGDAPAAAPPAAAPPAAAPAPAAAADDDDLFADEPASAPAKPVAPPPARAPQPSAPPPAPLKPPASVVEFADEVVEVRKPAPTPAAKAPAAAASGGATATASGRILQYNKQAGGAGGPLGDDFGQLGGGTRWIALLLILALGAGIVWVTMEMVR